MPGEQQGIQLSAKAQQQIGMTPGTRFYSPFPFSGMNVQSSSIAMDDKEFAWLENYFRIGDGKLRAAWDVGTPLFTRPGTATIVSFFSFNIGTVYYFAVFMSDGTAYQVNATTGIRTTISSVPNTFYVSGGSLPACTQWGALYLIISNRNTPNDYWVWDGSILYSKGSMAPGLVTMLSNGLNYTSIPSTFVYGGSGSGIVLTPTINDGGVIELSVANPGSGYQPGDIVQVAFTGGGSDNSAVLIANLSSGGVTACNITAPGSNYTSATVAFTGGGGSGAAGTVLIGSGVTGVTLSNNGTGYSGATVSFSSGGGSGATATATVVGGEVVSITITNPGTGYTSAPTVHINGDGSSAAGTATIQGGIVTGILMTNPGSGYTSAPAAVISGTGSGATAQAVINSSGVASVSVPNGGSGFLYAPTISFEGGGGAEAAGTVNLMGTSIASVNVINGGLSYTLPPTVSFSGGGGGSGAAATAVIAGGQVVAINVTNAGSGYINTPSVTLTNASGDTTGSGATAQAIFVPTSIASVTMSNNGFGYTTAPAVVIAAGANNAAYAATLNLMPYGISGDSIETFQSRVFIANPAPGQFTTIPPGGNFAVSAPESLFDFATSAGGVLEQSTDSFLQTRYVAIRQTNGYLYFFGDGSVSVLSNIQTAGTPPATTFNYQNVDPQIGCSWRDSRQDFSRTILFGNETGAYGLYGGAVTKISGKLDDIFVNALFPPTGGALTPSGASATIFDVQHYFMLLTLKDQNTGSFRNAMIHWNQKEWGIASQSANLIYIGTQKIASKLFAWGTDGHSLYPLFNQASATLPKTLYTKQYGADSPYMVKNFIDLYVQANDKSSGQSGVSFSTQLNVGGIQSQNIQNPNNPLASVPSENLPGGLIAPPIFAAGSITTNWPVFGVGTGGIPFITMGMAISSTSPDFELGNLSLAYLPEVVNQ